jgi:hypothetical protein
MKSRIPRPLARRIDRLARRAHRFHRFAHHPLCEEYGGELVQLGGRARLCRGCAMFAAGGIVGVLAAVVVRPAPVVAAVVAACGALVAASSLKWRTSKWLTRFAAAAGFGFAMGNLWTAVATISLAGLLALAYRRRGPNRSPCASCPEKSFATCRGMTEIVRAERAFQRLSSRWLYSASNVMTTYR